MNTSISKKNMHADFVSQKLQRKISSITTINAHDFGAISETPQWIDIRFLRNN